MRSTFTDDLSLKAAAYRRKCCGIGVGEWGAATHGVAKSLSLSEPHLASEEDTPDKVSLAPRPAGLGSSS